MSSTSARYPTCKSVAALAKALGTSLKCCYTQAGRMGLTRARPSPPGRHSGPAYSAAVHIVDTAIHAQPELQQLITEKWK